MTLDAVEWWFDNQAESPYFGDPPGAVCYLAGGQRVRDFARLEPNGGGFKQPPCNSGA
jgi:hypothetical protein